MTYVRNTSVERKQKIAEARRHLLLILTMFDQQGLAVAVHIRECVGFGKGPVKSSECMTEAPP